MPQNTKDSSGGKNHPVKDSSGKSGKSGKSAVNDPVDSKTSSPIGSQKHGEKKTTP